jgi:hypothetical protein
MEASILKSTKKILGLADEYDVFDLDVITHINAAFATLNQLGVGPAAGFMIEDESALWDDYLGELPTITLSMLSMIKTYVSLKVSILFDPPTMGYLIDLKTKQIDQLEFRITVAREEVLNAQP